MARLVNQTDNLPTRKVAGGGLAGAIVAIVVGVVGIELPPEVIAALTTIVSFGVAWLMRERSDV